jgi:pSer/pThr/pTyr-binding forkhead associated (FHA) protein
VTIGRGAECGITLADSKVSAEHAQLKREGSSYVYLDLKSTNGSFLIIEGREERLRSSQALMDGDEIRLGQTVLKFIRVQEGGRR